MVEVNTQILKNYQDLMISKENYFAFSLRDK